MKLDGEMFAASNKKCHEPTARNSTVLLKTFETSLHMLHLYSVVSVLFLTKRRQ